MSDGLFWPSGGSAAGAIKKGTVAVSYPVGASCIISNGTKTYAALDSSGAAAFAVDAGEWTVTISQAGRNPVSKAVTVTAGGWASVELSFSLLLYAAGEEFESVTGGWTNSGGSLTKNESDIEFNSGGSLKAHLLTVNAIPFNPADYATLTFSFSSIVIQTPYGGAKCGVYDSSKKEIAVCTLTASAEPIDVAIDVSSVSGEYFVGVQCSGNYNTSSVWSKGFVTMTEVVME